MQIKAGRVRALAITSAKRSPVSPELPTVAEAGNTPAEFAAFMKSEHAKWGKLVRAANIQVE